MGMHCFMMRGVSVKNIIIMGVGRAGKSTLSKMIKDLYPQYDVVHADAIKWGIISAQGKEPEFRKDIRKQMEWEKSRFFQNVLIEVFAHNVIHKHTPLILDTGQLYLETLLAHPKYNLIKESTDVIVLGIGERTSLQRVQLCEEYDTKADWTYNLSSEKLLDYAVDWTNQDLKRIEECKYYGIPYYDTSVDRVHVLSRICQSLSDGVLK